MKNVVIMVVAQNISADLKNRFEGCIRQSRPKVSYAKGFYPEWG